MSKKYRLKEKYRRKLSHFLLCQMKIMIVVSLAIIGMNSFLTNVHAQNETYGICERDVATNNFYVSECDEHGNSTGRRINVENVTYLYIDENIENIYTIAGSNVHTVNFKGNSIRTIWENAYKEFIHLETLINFTNQTQLEKIYPNAFTNTKLTSIQLPASVNDIDENAFTGCSTLESITVNNGNTTYYSKDNVLFEKSNENDVKVLYKYPEGKTDENYTIPDNVETINNYAFYNVDHLKNITIPATVNTIKDSAFENSKIKNILFEGTLPTFGSDVFLGANTDLKLYTLNSNDANTNDGLELYKAPILTVENSLVGKVGESFPIQARLNADATFRDTIDYTYTSTDSNVASVNQLGVVEMNEAGTTNIKVTASDPFKQAEKTIIVNVEEEVIDEGNQEIPPTDPDSGETPNQPGNDNNNPGQPENNDTPSQPGTDNNPNQPESNVTPSQPTIKPQENQKESDSSKNKNQPVQTNDQTMLIEMIGMLLLSGIGILSLRRKES